jgi:Domain of unknown function (DUF4440)
VRQLSLGNQLELRCAVIVCARSVSAIRRLPSVFRSAAFLALCGLSLVSQLAAQDSIQAQVLAVDDRRFTAMIRADTTALRSMLAPDLAYTHTSGERQNRDEFLHTLASGDLRYESIVPVERIVRRLSAEAAVVIGRSTMRVEAAGQVRAFTIRYVAVYQRTTEGWQLVVWQSTRLP